MNNTSLQIFELSLNQAGKAPSRVQILPAGLHIKGRDGRSFRLSDPEGLVARFNARQEPTPVDYEHGSEIKARQGEKSPAAGWVTGLEHEPQVGVFATIEWTPTAASEIQERAYRFISPAVLQTPNGEIKGISSLGLTHKPNLEIAALNRKDDEAMNKQTKQTEAPPAYLAELGLEADASPEKVAEAIKALKAKGEESKEDAPSVEDTVSDSQVETPALNNMVPRADYDALAGTVQALQKQLNSVTEAAHSEKVEVALNNALQQGKIVPASVDYYRQCCMQEGGLKAFEAFIETAPSLGGMQLSLNNQLANQEAETPEDRLVKAQLGIED